MLNALWLNSQALNLPGLLARQVALAAEVSCTVTADAPILGRRQGLAANLSVLVTQQAELQRAGSLAANRSIVISQQAIMSPFRRLVAEGLTFVIASVDWQAEKLLEGGGGVTVDGVLYPYDAILEGEEPVSVLADTPELERIKRLSAQASIGVTAVQDAPFIMGRNMAGSVAVSVAQGAMLNVESGGVTYGLLGTFSAVSVQAVPPEPLITAVLVPLPRTAGAVGIAPGVGVLRKRQLGGGNRLVSALGQATMAPRRIFAAPAVTAAVAATPMRLARTVRCTPIPRSAAVSAAPGGIKVDYRLAAAAMVVVSSSIAAADLDRLAGLRPEHAMAVVVQHPPDLRDNREGRLAGIEIVRVSVEAPVLRDNREGRMSGTALVGIEHAQVPLTVERLVEGLPTHLADVQAEATLFRLVELSASAGSLAWVDALGDLFTNPEETEPDYRTLIVPPQSFVLLIAPQDTVLVITRDTVPMKTFTKQPADRLPYDLDFREWFADIPGDEIETVSAAVVEATDGDTSGLTLMSAVPFGEPAHYIKVWLDGGANGTTYKITALAETEGGRRKEVDFKLRIKEV